MNNGKFLLVMVMVMFNHGQPLYTINGCHNKMWSLLNITLQQIHWWMLQGDMNFDECFMWHNCWWLSQCDVSFNECCIVTSPWIVGITLRQLQCMFPCDITTDGCHNVTSTSKNVIMFVNHGNHGQLWSYVVKHGQLWSFNHDETC